MKFNKWTVGLAAVGVVSFASAARADEQMSQVQTALTQTTLSGYVDTAMQWNPGTDQTPASVGNGTGILGNGVNVPNYSFAKNDGFSLNAVDIALDRPEDSSAWAAGYHVELMAGADSVGVGVAGNLALRQAFIRLHTPIGGNGIDWQIGVFDSVIGYESNSDPLNPNYTRSYGYTIEPTTLTGIMGTYKVNDMISFSAGISDSAFNNSFVATAGYESQKAYFGTVAFTAPDSAGFLKGATVSAGVIHAADSSGTFGINTDNGNTTTSLYAGATIPTPITQLKVGASFDYLFENASANALSGSTVTDGDDIWNVALYGTFQATDKLSFNARAEYLSDDTRGFDDAVTLYGGFDGNRNAAEEITATIQYNLWANVITRAEFRWDHVEHGDPFGAEQGDVGNPYKSNDFLLALNVIYQF